MVINPIVGVYIPIIRIPIKGGRFPIPNKPRLLTMAQLFFLIFGTIASTQLQWFWTKGWQTWFTPCALAQFSEIWVLKGTKQWQDEHWKAQKVCIILFERTCWYLGGGFKYLLFLPLPGEMIQFDSYFQMGWNHQLDMDYSIYIYIAPMRKTCRVRNPLNSGFPFQRCLVYWPWVSFLLYGGELPNRCSPNDCGFDITK